MKSGLCPWAIWVLVSDDDTNNKEFCLSLKRRGVLNKMGSVFLNLDVDIGS